jgi:hypothetical protein
MASSYTVLRPVRFWLLPCLLLPMLTSCGDDGSAAKEGDAAGECKDGADNDSDGLFDCKDPDCSGSSDCGGSEGEGEGEGEGASASCTPSTTDGQTACDNDTCISGEWCDQIFCKEGCQSTANCAQGSYCDKTGSTDYSGAGVCRSCVDTVCDPVGNYNLVGKSSNPEECPGSGQCSVTQSGTKVTITCMEGQIVGNCTITNSCTCTFALDAGEGSVQVEIDFWGQEAQISGGGLLCEYLSVM